MMRGNWTSVVLAAALAWAGTAMAGETAKHDQPSSTHTGAEQQSTRTGGGDASTAGTTSDPSAMPDDPSRMPPGEDQGVRQGEDVRTGYQRDAAGSGTSTSGSSSADAPATEKSNDLEDPGSARETEVDRQMQGEGGDRKPADAGGK